MGKLTEERVREIEAHLDDCRPIERSAALAGDVRAMLADRREREAELARLRAANEVLAGALQRTFDFAREYASEVPAITLREMARIVRPALVEHAAGEGGREANDVC